MAATATVAAGQQGTGSHSGGGSLTASGAACVGDSQGGDSRVSTGMLAPLLETNEEAAEEVAEVALGETRPHSRDPGGGGC